MTNKHANHNIHNNRYIPLQSMSFGCDRFCIGDQIRRFGDRQEVSHFKDARFYTEHFQLYYHVVFVDCTKCAKYENRLECLTFAIL